MWWTRSCADIRNAAFFECWIDPQQHSRDLLSNHIGDITLDFIDRKYPAEIPDEEFYGLLVREHILLQLEYLAENEFVHELVEDGRLRLHGWLIDDFTCRVRAFSPILLDFVPLEEFL